MTLDEQVAAYRAAYPYTTRSEAEIRAACQSAATAACMHCRASGPEVGLEWHFSGTQHRRGDRYIRCIDRQACAERQIARREVVPAS